MTNAIAILEPRQTPITTEDFDKIETLVEKHFHTQTMREGRSMPKVDNAGETYGWEYQTIETGLRMTPKASLDPRLLDSIRRPVTKQILAYHLTRLSAHKRNTRGGFAFQVIVEDACRDLDGVSEWAVFKAYDQLRKADGPFFPDLEDIVKAVKWFDDAARNIGTPAEPVKPKPVPVQQEEPWEKPTDAKKAAVAKLMHNAGLPHDREFCEQCGEGGS